MFSECAENKGARVREWPSLPHTREPQHLTVLSTPALVSHQLFSLVAEFSLDQSPQRQTSIRSE